MVTERKQAQTICLVPFKLRFPGPRKSAWIQCSSDVGSAVSRAEVAHEESFFPSSCASTPKDLPAPFLLFTVVINNNGHLLMWYVLG